MRSEKLDFVQVNYSADDRAAERRILPLAAERGAAVLINMPFGGGGLLRRLRARALPAWAAELGCSTWAQLLLKFVLGHPAVTCVIPGTSNPAHMRENAASGAGTLPDGAMRARIAAAINE
jgi:aryl-alcohol dehydrogenase-like predicted oxidoreductase